MSELTMTASHAPSTVAKKATNVSLSETVLADAKALRINISQAAEAGVARAVAERRAALWVAENAKAFECWNDYVEKNGLPLAKYRSF
jgi:antitoxin CcdA